MGRSGGRTAYRLIDLRLHAFMDLVQLIASEIFPGTERECRGATSPET